MSCHRTLLNGRPTNYYSRLGREMGRNEWLECEWGEEAAKDSAVAVGRWLGHARPLRTNGAPFANLRLGYETPPIPTSHNDRPTSKGAYTHDVYTEKEGGAKMPQFGGFSVHKFRTKERGGQKIQTFSGRHMCIAPTRHRSCNDASRSKSALRGPWRGENSRRDGRADADGRKGGGAKNLIRTDGRDGEKSIVVGRTTIHVMRADSRGGCCSCQIMTHEYVIQKVWLRKQ